MRSYEPLQQLLVDFGRRRQLELLDEKINIDGAHVECVHVLWRARASRPARHRARHCAAL